MGKRSEGEEGDVEGHGVGERSMAVERDYIIDFQQGHLFKK